MNKYRNKPCEVGGEKYRSQKEAKRHQELLILLKAGEIEELKREIPFTLANQTVIGGKKVRAMRYVADFVYYDRKSDDVVIEDCKGVRTRVYLMKRHLMRTIHGIEIKET